MVGGYICFPFRFAPVCSNDSFVSFNRVWLLSKATRRTVSCKRTAKIHTPGGREFYTRHCADVCRSFISRRSSAVHIEYTWIQLRRLSQAALPDRHLDRAVRREASESRRDHDHMRFQLRLGGNPRITRKISERMKGDCISIGEKYKRNMISYIC